MSSYASLKLASVYDEVDAPLLDQTEVDYDEEDDISSNVPSQAEDAEENEASSPSEEPIVSFVYAGLLIAQFGMSVCIQQRSAAFSTLVFFSIGLFLLSSALYKDALNENTNKRSLCILLPEVMVNIIVGVIYFLKVEWGFLALLACMMVLKFAVIFMTIRGLLEARNSGDKCGTRTQTSNDLLVCQVV